MCGTPRLKFVLLVGMSKMEFQVSDPAESSFLSEIELRLVLPEEVERWNGLVIQHHYLGNATMVGEQLRYVALHRGKWIALLGWSAAAYHLKGRDQWIGWNANQRRARLLLVVNDARYCLLSKPGEHPNLASYVMGLNLKRLSRDWQEAYGHPILIVESFVDLQLFRGTCYKATGWKAIGCTAGFKRVAEDFYQVHDRPKQLFVRELIKHAARKLRSRALPEEMAGHERPVRLECLFPNEHGSQLRAILQQWVPESRSVHGLRHKQATVLTITFAYLLAGGRGGHRGIVLFAKDLTPTQRAAFGCWFNRRSKRYEVPTENCVYRVLKAVPVLEFQQAIWAWQKARLGREDGDVVVLDGKALRGSGGTQLVGAINARSGRTLGIETVADKSNEIPAGQTLLDRLDLEGTIALMDALHTQVETAHRVVQEGGGEYVMVVKGNQPTVKLQAQISLPENFSPSMDDGRFRSRSDRVARHRGGGDDARPDVLSPCRTSCAG